VRVGDDSDVEFWAREDRGDERRKERIRIAIAGPIAEANYAGSSAGGGSDIPLAHDLVAELGVTRAESSDVLVDLAAEVRATLKKASVEKLAEAILRTGSLSKNELLAELERLHWPP
jgi:hypothetical protein